jgi:hypothetical protein
LTKDLILDPDTTVHFVLSEADLDSVREKRIEIHFFEMKEPRPDIRSGAIVMPALTSTEIQATLGSKAERLFWGEGDEVPMGPVDGDWKKLRELQVLIRRILERQPAYKALPPARGGNL